MAPLRGRAARGRRLIGHAPFGHWTEAWMRHWFEHQADG